MPVAVGVGMSDMSEGFGGTPWLLCRMTEAMRAYCSTKGI